MRVAVLGATGRTGRCLVPRLCDAGHAVTAISRSTTRLAVLDPRAEGAVADLERPETVAEALADAECVVSLAGAVFTDALLAALPDSCRRVVLTGSLRKYTALPDPAADAVRASEAAFLASGRPGLMLYPSMIYGAPEDGNVSRILRLLQRWPRWLPVMLPVPDGGRATVQPVFVDDVVDALTAAVALPNDGAPRRLVVAGPEPIPYAAMLRACARAMGRRLWLLPAPTGPLVAAVGAARRLGLPLPVTAPELRRFAEDKAFDVTPLHECLGVAPRSFAEGLRLKLERGWL